MEKVAVGLSGGVDSSVAAALLIDQGFKVVGVHLTCFDGGKDCVALTDHQDALDVAIKLNIPLVQLDFIKEYHQKVYEYMMAEYELGRTPNPDVMCNKEIKFGLFYNWAVKEGFDFIATGHYAQIINGKLIRSRDEHKDQTYFLYQLNNEQLKKIMFPVGHLTKLQVRREAKSKELFTADKPDSVGICFVGEVPMKTFLQQRIRPKKGQVLLWRSEMVVGDHLGVWFYTIGQRLGLINKNDKNLALAGFNLTNLPPLYVIKKDIVNNKLYVGKKDALNRTELTINQIHWISGSLTKVETVRIRHTGELVPVVSFEVKKGIGKITLAKAVTGVSAGQSVVCYRKKICLGGGIILDA